MKHGTPGGYQIHRRRKEDACQPCKTAHNAYRARCRREGQENARERALRRLARLYPAEFRRIFYAELSAERAA